MTTSSLSVTLSGNEDTELTVALAEPERDPNTFITSRGAAVHSLTCKIHTKLRPGSSASEFDLDLSEGPQGLILTNHHFSGLIHSMWMFEGC